MRCKDQHVDEYQYSTTENNNQILNLCIRLILVDHRVLSVELEETFDGYSDIDSYLTSSPWSDMNID